MQILLPLLIVLLSLSFGIVCLRDPMKIAWLMVKWVKFASHDMILDPNAREAVYLMENNPDEYTKKFYKQLDKINFIGKVIITVSIIGSCIIVFGK